MQQSQFEEQWAKIVQDKWHLTKDDLIVTHTDIVSQLITRLQSHSELTPFKETFAKCYIECERLLADNNSSNEQRLTRTLAIVDESVLDFRKLFAHKLTNNEFERFSKLKITEIWKQFAIYENLPCYIKTDIANQYDLARFDTAIELNVANNLVNQITQILQFLRTDFDEKVNYDKRLEKLFVAWLKHYKPRLSMVIERHHDWIIKSINKKLNWVLLSHDNVKIKQEQQFSSLYIKLLFFLFNQDKREENVQKYDLIAGELVQSEFIKIKTDYLVTYPEDRDKSLDIYFSDIDRLVRAKSIHGKSLDEYKVEIIEMSKLLKFEEFVILCQMLFNRYCDEQDRLTHSTNAVATPPVVKPRKVKIDSEEIIQIQKSNSIKGQKLLITSPSQIFINFAHKLVLTRIVSQISNLNSADPVQNVFETINGRTDQNKEYCFFQYLEKSKHFNKSAMFLAVNKLYDIGEKVTSLRLESLLALQIRHSLRVGLVLPDVPHILCMLIPHNTSISSRNSLTMAAKIAGFVQINFMSRLISMVGAYHQRRMTTNYDQSRKVLVIYGPSHNFEAAIVCVSKSTIEVVTYSADNNSVIESCLLKHIDPKRNIECLVYAGEASDQFHQIRTTMQFNSIIYDQEDVFKGAEHIIRNRIFIISNLTKNLIIKTDKNQMIDYPVYLDDYQYVGAQPPSSDSNKTISNVITRQFKTSSDTQRLQHGKKKIAYNNITPVTMELQEGNSPLYKFTLNSCTTGKSITFGVSFSLERNVKGLYLPVLSSHVKDELIISDEHYHSCFDWTKEMIKVNRILD